MLQPCNMVMIIKLLENYSLHHCQNFQENMEIISKVILMTVISIPLQLSLAMEKEEDQNFHCMNSQLSINCGAFKITKTERHYKIQLCTSNDEEPCTMKQNFINCNDICEVCVQLSEVDHNGKQK